MATYNPEAPQILGQEWTPIRNQGVVFSPSVNAVELGHTFTLAQSRTLQDARFYIDQPPPGYVENQVYMVGIYPRGKEAASGPVRSVLIPCNSGAITGSVNFSVSIPTSLAAPGDGFYVLVEPNADLNAKSMNLFFATNDYAKVLAGKRILAVNLVTQMSWNPLQSGVAGSVSSRQVVYSQNQALDLETGTGATSFQHYVPITATYGNALNNLPGIVIGDISTVTDFQRVHLGEVNPFWFTPSTAITPERLPWRYEELQRFEATAGVNRYRINIKFGASTDWAGQYQMGYAALEVIFCEENRVAYGSRVYGSPGSASDGYRINTNIIPLRDTSFNASPALLAGTYSVVVSSPDVGDIQGPFSLDETRPAQFNTYPTLNALQQLYPIDGLEGVQVNLTQKLDETFTRETTNILPQLSLHTSTGPLTEVHVYGEQARAQVYGNVTATQDILDSAAQGAGSYPWVRYYARRFGNTTVPLRLDMPSVTGAGTYVEITPAAFDLLDEIVDGWKEVTLRFTVAPTMGSGTNPLWRWSASGEMIGNRWEVLGAVAPAISGVPGNLLNLVPSPNQLSLATYGAPTSGSNINLAWLPGIAPLVSAITDDPTADAMLIFAKDMLTITGFSSSIQDQTVTGIGLDCGVNPCCVPSTIKYVQLTWGLPVNTGYALDSFTRTVAPGGWGNADSGQAWNTSATSTTYEVNGTTGIATITTASSRIARLTPSPNPSPDQDVRATITMTTSVISSNYGGGVLLRLTDSNNYYSARVVYGTTDATLLVEQTLAGSTTTLASVTLFDLLPSISAARKIRATVVGNRILAKAWSDTEPEPDWQIDIISNTFTTGDISGILFRGIGGNTTVVYNVDDFSVSPPDIYFGSLELQRMDTVTTDWQTIMQSTSTLTTGFRDYEARVGILSSYRIRAIDVYGFEGPWSSTVTATIPAPGVTIGCNTGHLLIFTSNEEQDGSINLAYSNAWESGQRVEENFVFPEAGFVQLQAMYNRDFFVAFRPLERGGEQFNRTILVQAAAISPETLADFTGLRDMAWANVSYICVRDEEGNRWFATVLVPGGRVLRDRRLYLAPVDVIEVTDTPSPVNP